MKFVFLIVILAASLLFASHKITDISPNLTNSNATDSLKDNITLPNKAIYQDFENTSKMSFTPLASYSTPLGSSTAERVNNITIVCGRLNNYILRPGETFSYNEVCGPYGPSDGFEEATILLSDGSEDKGFGGGVCQLSSTLYNVVAKIPNMAILERHHHSVEVSYVPKNQDATVSLQSNLDFKFKNDNEFSIKFEAICDDKNVVVNAYKI